MEASVLTLSSHGKRLNMSDMLIFTWMVISFLSTLFLVPAYTLWFNTAIKKYPKAERFIPVIVIGAFFGYIMAGWYYRYNFLEGLGELFPWEIWEIESISGYGNGVLIVMINVCFLLWAFFLPAHLYSWRKYKENKTRPMCPYIVNLLAGYVVTDFDFYYFWILT